jgi:4a-hydroxytetrahydrobiopterin dehydratase
VSDIDAGEALSRTAASEAVEALGWRYLLGTLSLSVPVRSLSDGAGVAAAAISVTGEQADGHLRIDLRPNRLELSLQDRGRGVVTRRDLQLAGEVSAVLGETASADSATTRRGSGRPVQMLELAIDAQDIPAIRPFWKAVFAYEDEPGGGGPEDALVDPAGQLPSIWFQQMDAPRPQRNRVHFDVTVAHDEVEARVRSALDAGGVLVNDSLARSFWVLADAEGNEVCVCTWLDRDER